MLHYASRTVQRNAMLQSPGRNCYNHPVQKSGTKLLQSPFGRLRDRRKNQQWACKSIYANDTHERYVPDGLTSSPHPQCSTRKAVDAVVSPWPSQEPPISVQKLQVSFAVLPGGASSWDRLLLQLQRQDVDWHDRLLHLLARQRQMR